MSHNVVSASIDPSDPEFESWTRIYQAAVQPDIGQPGSDPSPFIPEPRGLYEILAMSPRYRAPWLKAFRDEITGLNKLGVWKLGEPRPGDKVIPVMEVYKCKIGPEGLLDKLKCRVVYRGDLDNVDRGIDPWNPHATFLSLKFFLAWAARIDKVIWQADMVQAYVNVPIRHTRVFVKLPDYWRPHVPDDIKMFIGVPLELQKALYGAPFSSRLLYEALAEFLNEYGLNQGIMNGFWFKRLPNNGLLIFLQYSDDNLSACSDDETHEEFRRAFASKFPLKYTPNASWYLASHINRDQNGNVSLDQFRYSRAIIQRYLPNESAEPSTEELTKYVDPLPNDFVWTADDNSDTVEEARQLETEFGFRAIEVVGSLNYLNNTSVNTIFSIRKAAKHTR
jgi:hypothetical protein